MQELHNIGVEVHSSHSSDDWSVDTQDLDQTYTGMGTSRVYSPDKSLMCLERAHPVREFCINLVDNKWFDRFILLAIVVNCVFLAMATPNLDPDSARQRAINYAEIVFATVFTVEMVFKIVAMGFVNHPYAYLRDPWNILDFVVVILGYLSLLPGVANYSAVRTFRVFRALRALSGVEGLRVVVNTLIKSLPPLMNVFGLLFFFMIVFAIVGVQLFAGRLRQHCVDDNTGKLWEDDASADNICTMASYGGRICPKGYECEVKGPNPNYGLMNFDTFGFSLLAVIQLVTMDEWEGVLNAVMQATTGWSSIYFFAVIMFGSLFIVNLVVAVVYSSYEQSLTVVDMVAEWNGAGQFNESKAAARVDVWGEFELPEEIEDVNEEPPYDPTVWDRGEGTAWLSFAKGCHSLANSGRFTAFVVVIIVLNTVCLAMEYPGMPVILENILWWANLTFTIIFFVEMVIKLIGLTPSGYIKDNFNIFDGTIVIFSLIELMIGNGAGLSVLRAFRLLRVFKLARSWVSLRKLLEIVTQSLGNVGNITLVMSVMMFVFALVGMQVFGGKFDGLEDPTRTNFDNVWFAFISVFRILIGEWIVALTDAILATGLSAVIYFMVVLMVGNYLILNLFLAVLLSNFEAISALNDAAEEEILPLGRFAEWRKRHFGFCSNPPEEEGDDQDAGIDTTDNIHAEEMIEEINAGASVSNIADITKLYVQKGREKKKKEQMEHIHVEEESTGPKKLYGTSLCIFETTDSRRLFVQSIVENEWFERTILLLIIVSSGSLAFESPGASEDTLRVLNVLNWIFAIVFQIECLLKIVAYGFAFHYGAYLTDNWNRLDFFIVIISWFSLLLAGSGLNALRSIRTLRAFRPLRAITRNEGMKVVVNALLKSIPAIFNVILVCGLFWLIFGILGVQFFGGQFGYCTYPDVADKMECLKFGMFNTTSSESSATVSVEAEWVNPAINFDNIINAFLALFQVATFEGWYDLFYSAIDSAGIDQQPIHENRPYAAIYFIMFITVGSFFIMNLFVGVVIDEFNRLKKEMDGAAFLSPSQLKWVQAQRMMLKNRPQAEIPRPDSPLRAKCYDLVTTNSFAIFIMACIVLNMLLMCFDHYEPEGYKPTPLDVTVEVLNYVFSVIFIAEAVLKLLAFAPRRYFEDHWNKFDFFIVVISIIGIVFAILGAALPVNPTLLRVLRIFRVARIFRIIKTAKGLKKLLMTLLYSLPALFNVACLLFLVYFVYAILGMSMFGEIKHGGAINDEVNFENFGNSILLLFRISTASGWNEVFADCSVEPPDCDPDKGNCGNRVIAAVYFVSFVLVGFFIMVNLYVAVILENFDLASAEDAASVSDDDLAAFAEKWTVFDPDATYKMKLITLPKFVITLDPPLGIGRKEGMNEDEVMGEILRLDLPVHGLTDVHFLEVLIALAKRVSEDVDLPPHLEKKMKKRFAAAFPDLVITEQNDEDIITTQKIGATLRIQHWFHEYKKRKVAAEAAEAAGGFTNGGKHAGKHASSSLSDTESSGAGARVAPDQVRMATLNNNNEPTDWSETSDDSESGSGGGGGSSSGVGERNPVFGERPLSERSRV